MPQKKAPEPPDNASAFKHLFGVILVRRLSNSLHKAWPQFNRRRFTLRLKELPALEMKARVHLIRDALARELPEAYPDALQIIMNTTTTGELKGFDIWPYTEFIQSYGLKHQTLSLNALKKLTTLFTAEWAVRPFLRTAPESTLTWLKRCATDRNVHVRRWASEGSRPRLPWGERLNLFIDSPELTLPILELLKHDPELYVRKSIANHLNDIAKDNPHVVLATLKRWIKSAPKEHASKIEWITHRALRTLIKAGEPAALRLIGVNPGAELRLSSFKSSPSKLKVGERALFSFILSSRSRQDERVVIDYIVHYLRANGKLSPKVFKLKSVNVSSGAQLFIQGRHHFREVTTRSHYPGVHKIEIQINGLVVKRFTLELQS